MRQRSIKNAFSSLVIVQEEEIVPSSVRLIARVHKSRCPRTLTNMTLLAAIEIFIVIHLPSFMCISLQTRYSR